MDIVLKEITVADLVDGYRDDGADGVRGYGGDLDIRPAFQREFVYGDKERMAVIDTILKDYPLNVMYWSDQGDDKFEIIDGQQRTISVAQYVQGEFSFPDLFTHHDMFFDNLPANKQQMIMDYELMVYVCTGDDEEKLDWFKTINIAGKELTNQELRNAVYSGPWVSDAKRWFSRNGGPAQKLAGKYVKGNPIRQDYLETAIRWISDGTVDEYMALHQKQSDAKELWSHFQQVIQWVKDAFPKYREPMKNVDWGPLYDNHKNDVLDPDELEADVSALMEDDDVKRKPGVYLYVLTGHEHHLNLRAFSKNTKQSRYEKQNGKCAKCGEAFDFPDMDGDHITPWVEGGKTVEDNCQMLCRGCNRRKGSK